MPTNLKMTALKAAFEAAGFVDVKTVLASGNVLFSAPRQTTVKLAKKAEATLSAELGQTFPTFIEPVEELRALIEDNPWKRWKVPAAAKRVVTILRTVPRAAVELPVHHHEGVTIWGRDERRVFTTYLPGHGPVFMALLQKTFGDDITTRTWDTLAKLTR